MTSKSASRNYPLAKLPPSESFNSVINARSVNPRVPPSFVSSDQIGIKEREKVVLLANSTAGRIIKKRKFWAQDAHLLSPAEYGEFDTGQYA
jgi:hypothetical protein